MGYTRPGYVNSLLLKIATEIVDFPIKNGGSFHSYVSLAEGIWWWSWFLFWFWLWLIIAAFDNHDDDDDDDDDDEGLCHVLHYNIKELSSCLLLFLSYIKMDDRAFRL